MAATIFDAAEHMRIVREERGSAESASEENV
jgi:hypothetical protein